MRGNANMITIAMETSALKGFNLLLISRNAAIAVGMMTPVMFRPMGIGTPGTSTFKNDRSTRITTARRA